ncbi:MAG: hypothetical protein FRX49_06118 [Trebouxia sp. A1-2]|nr:MAG: hypothetical protein FRX49_06118 [Trebouxia sp. A1-2]
MSSGRPPGQEPLLDSREPAATGTGCAGGGCDMVCVALETRLDVSADVDAARWVCRVAEMWVREEEEEAEGEEGRRSDLGCKQANKEELTAARVEWDIWVMQDMEWLRLIGVGPDSTTSLPSMPCWVTPCWHCHSEMAAQAYLVRSKTQINVQHPKENQHTLNA